MPTPFRTDDDELRDRDRDRRLRGEDDERRRRRRPGGRRGRAGIVNRIRRRAADGLRRLAGR